MTDISTTDLDELQKQLEAQLKQDFIDECSQKIENISQNLEKIAGGAPDAYENIIRIMGDIHTMKGMGASLGYPVITVIAHRAEEFLKDSDTLSLEDIKGTYAFVDKISEMLKLPSQPSSEEISAIAKNLPSKQKIELGDQKRKTIEVLSVMPKSMQQRIINKELEACGLDVLHVHKSIDALQIAVNTKPDLIVLSALIDTISGIELANVLRAIVITKETPVIVVTSFDERVLPEETLPAKVAIARKGKEFAEDISECLLELGIMA